MKDEVLQKAVDTDTDIIPRFDLVSPDGTVIASNVRLVLKNPVLTQGTPLNKKTLLSDDTARALGLTPTTATPDEAFSTLRASIGYCPKLKVDYFQGGEVHVLKVGNISGEVYDVPSPGSIIIDLDEYTTYRIWCVFAGVETDPIEVVVDTTKLYTLDFREKYVKWMLITPNSKQADFTVVHPKGYIFTYEHHSGPSIYLPVVGEYTAAAVGVYDGLYSNVVTLNVTAEDLDAKKTVVTNLTWP